MAAAFDTIPAMTTPGTKCKRLSDFDLLSFDCYGTLIDWETGIWDALQPLIMHNGGCSLGRGDALALFADREHRVQEEQPDLPYPEVLSRVHAAWAQGTGLQSTPALDRDFGRSIAHWPGFADTAEALRELQSRFRLVILSNVDRASFAASNRKLGVVFDGVYTAEDIGSYKPAAANFRYLIERHRILQARCGQFPLPDRAHGERSWCGSRADSAHGTKSLPRPRTGAGLRPGQLLDRPSAAVARRRLGRNGCCG